MSHSGMLDKSVDLDLFSPVYGELFTFENMEKRKCKIYRIIFY